MSTRRNFIKQSSLAATGTLLAASSMSKAFAIIKKITPGDVVNVGAIGINGMGWSDLTAMLKVPGVRLVALCDVDENVISSRQKELAALNIDASKVATYTDYRRMLENKDVDAVIIGTPDHWHCLQMVDACSAGKAVYVEKPIGNSIEECRLMVAARNRYNSVVQAGQWQRSMDHFKEAVAYVHSGVLGNIRTVKTWSYVGWKMPITYVADSPVPAGVHYDKWLGPAQMRPFNKNRFHFTFRWFWDYAGGLMTDWGVHLIDFALIGMKANLPKAVYAAGGRFADPSSPQETPDTLSAIYEYDNFNLQWDHAIGIQNGDYRKDHGIAFIGNNGTLVLNRGGWEVYEESKSDKKVSVAFNKASDNGLQKHAQNFIDVVRSNNFSDLKCPVEEAARVAIVSQMGNISYRSGEKLYWNDDKFHDKKINKKYLLAAYHNGYQLPKI